MNLVLLRSFANLEEIAAGLTLIKTLALLNPDDSSFIYLGKTNTGENLEKYMPLLKAVKANRRTSIPENIQIDLRLSKNIPVDKIDWEKSEDNEHYNFLLSNSNNQLNDIENVEIKKQKFKKVFLIGPLQKKTLHEVEDYQKLKKSAQISTSEIIEIDLMNVFSTIEITESDLSEIRKIKEFWIHRGYLQLSKNKVGFMYRDKDEKINFPDNLKVPAKIIKDDLTKINNVALNFKNNSSGIIEMNYEDLVKFMELYRIYWPYMSGNLFQESLRIRLISNSEIKKTFERIFSDFEIEINI